MLSSLDQYSFLLHNNEKNHADTLSFEKRRHSYLLGRICAKFALEPLVAPQETNNIYVDYGVFQFPVVKNVQNSNIQVSISHCDNIGLALAYPEEHPLGIDIEKVDDKIIETLDTQLTSKEKNLLTENNLFTPAGHTLLWTIKEGLSKIFRTGLMMDFKTLEIKSIELTKGIYESTYTHCGQYKALSTVIGNYVCSVVLPAKTNVDLDVFWNQLKSIISEN